MAEGGDSSEKTEEPTQRRIMKAVEEGQVVNSREVSNFFSILLLTFMIALIIPWFSSGSSLVIRDFVTRPHDFIINENSIPHILSMAAEELAFYILLPLVITMLVGVLSSVIQHPFIFSAKAIEPKLDRIDPIAGFKRLVSVRSLVEFLKGLFKISLVGIVTYTVIYPQFKELEILLTLSVIEIMAYLTELAFRVALAAAIIMVIIAVLDYLYQRYEYMKQLKMSKQELKEEFKQTEGSPEARQRLRQIRQERARQRMIQAVPDADVVIRNPTHFAVALKYDANAMAAPMVVAKGQDVVALRIIEVAEENDVPLVRNPPLARALFDSTEIDEAIPLQHWKAVAEVISYVYKLKGKTAQMAG